jgi:hypothetical protein
MRRLISAVALGVVLCAPALPAQAAPGVPQRPDGPVVPLEESDNGGDNGWGNCGHNSSGGNPPTKTDGRNGNGGYTKEDCVGGTDPSDPVDTAPDDSTTADEPTPDEPTPDEPIILV